MPDRKLTQEDDRKSIEKWLEDAFPYKNGFIPCKDEFNKHLDDNAIKDIFDRKGIYFWFLNKDGYKKLHELSETKIPGINLKLENPYIRKFNNEEYTLVYIGLAGAGYNEKTLTNDATLRSRVLDLHIKGNFTGSTLSENIAPLISDSFDKLSLKLIKDIYKKYFRILVIDYPGEYLDIFQTILDDENFLINEFLPVFNLTNNTNAQIDGHATKLIKDKKSRIEKI